MIEFARRTRHVREPDLTPLVDIVFKLVLFFMLTTTFIVSESMELTLPRKGATPPAASAEVMRIQITSEGYVTIDGATVGRETMERTLLERIGDAPDLGIAIFTTPGVSVQQLVSVMDMVYLSGGRNVQVDRLEYPAESAGAS